MLPSLPDKGWVTVVEKETNKCTFTCARMHALTDKQLLIQTYILGYGVGAMKIAMQYCENVIQLLLSLVACLVIAYVYSSKQIQRLL